MNFRRKINSNFNYILHNVFCCCISELVFILDSDNKLIVLHVEVGTAANNIAMHCLCEIWLTDCATLGHRCFCHASLCQPMTCLAVGQGAKVDQCQQGWRQAEKASEQDNDVLATQLWKLIGDLSALQTFLFFFVRGSLLCSHGSQESISNPKTREIQHKKKPGWCGR